MTLEAVRSALIEAGMNRWILAIEDGQLFVRFDDLEDAKKAAITRLVRKTNPIMTDKGFVWQA